MQKVKVAFIALSCQTKISTGYWGAKGWMCVLLKCIHTSLSMRAGGRKAKVSMSMTEQTVESVLFSSFLLSWVGIELRSLGVHSKYLYLLSLRD